MSIPITLKQLETIFWIARLGTFERAAMKLNTTQSAISKRIQELELSVGTDLFDRSLRGARLTEKGEYLVRIAEEMLDLQGRISSLRDGATVPVHRIRLGVTELIAMTWLPRMVTLLHQTYPGVVLEPEVDMARNLYERLLDDQVDVIVIPETFGAPEVTAVTLAQVQNEWMAAPGLVQGAGQTLTLQELSGYPILAQGTRSGSGLHFSKWMRNQGIVFPRQIGSDSMTALLGLTIAGLGISYMPRDCFSALIDEGKLEVIAAEPALPLVPYAAMYRNDRPTSVSQAVVDLARQACDFSSQFQK
ncbi:LysR family transcriptional regulator [Gemmobacter sp.]|uniref:LysR family transcriptional regulator n=1 Tax=Gemmobacter sp. TaxID=1898957 RepID=UPI002AFDFC4C|nr:LysR family transcriptional regulator [Gemmobacter sp.]